MKKVLLAIAILGLLFCRCTYVPNGDGKHKTLGDYFDERDRERCAPAKQEKEQS